MKNVWMGVLCFLLVSITVLDAQDTTGENDRFTVKIAVLGPGDALYFWWGHIALIIEDSAAGTARFYDYGIFSFEGDHFYYNFAMGRLWYRSGVSQESRSIATYRNTNRDITIYTLDLPAAAKGAVRDFVEMSILPENSGYWYHHFKDNCSTRIRDIIDLATEGQFKAAYGEKPGRFTLRQHIRRYMYFSPFFDGLLNFLMGQDIDRTVTVWQEMFLPHEVGDLIGEFEYTDATGKLRKLVSSVEVVNQAVKRPQILKTPPQQWVGTLALGLVLAGAFAFLIIAQKRRPAHWRLVVMAVSQSILGLFLGVAGTVLYFMSFFTDHDYCYHNANVLFITPLLLAAVPLGIIVARNRVPKRCVFAGHLLRGVWTVAFLGCVLSMLIKLSPAFFQQNQMTLALVMPFVTVLAVLPRLLEFRSGRRR
jgi:hypothetical protein